MRAASVPCAAPAGCRFKSLRRDVPRGVLSYGMQELGAMLRSLLALAVGLGLGLY